MKIAIRGGHNPKATGASALIDEVIEDRKVCAAVIKYLKLAGHEVLDVTPASMDKRSDLYFGVKEATNFGAELFISIHFNNAYAKYNGAIGTETIIYPNSKTAYPYAKRINDNLVDLGFAKHSTGVINDTRGLYELRCTKCPAVIVEVCFVEATEDVKLYKQLGADLIGKAIAEGILGKEIRVESETQNKPMPLKVIHDMVAMGLDKNGQIYPVKEFHSGDLITVRRIVNRLGELDINGVKAYITMGYTANR